MSYFERHILFCTNQREPGNDSCNNHGAKAMCGVAKDKVKALGLNGPGKVRVSSAGCLGRCENGPVAVVYPEAIWYTYVDEQDIEEIVESHLAKGQVVDRLKI